MTQKDTGRQVNKGTFTLTADIVFGFPALNAIIQLQSVSASASKLMLKSAGYKQVDILRSSGSPLHPFHSTVFK